MTLTLISVSSGAGRRIPYASHSRRTRTVALQSLSWLLGSQGRIDTSIGHRVQVPSLRGSLMPHSASAGTGTHYRPCLAACAGLLVAAVRGLL